MLAKVDRAMFAAFCQCWGMYVEAVQDIAENGTTFTTETGYEVQRPSVGIAIKMLEKATQLGAKFGFTPSDRSKISLSELPNENAVVAFLRQKRGDG